MNIIDIILFYQDDQKSISEIHEESYPELALYITKLSKKEFIYIVKNILKTYKSEIIEYYITNDKFNEKLKIELNHINNILDFSDEDIYKITTYNFIHGDGWLDILPLINIDYSVLRKAINKTII